MSRGRRTEQNKRGLTSTVLVVALVAAVAGVGWIAFRPDSTNSADCDDQRKVMISVVPSMQMAMEKALEDLKSDDECFPAEIRTESPAAVEDSFFNGGRPDLWVADTSARVDRLASIGINTTTLTPSLAVTPIGLVGGKSAERPDSWVGALEANTISLGDPESDSATAMTLIAPVMESKETQASGERARASVVTAAQTYGKRAVEGDVDKTEMKQIGASFTRLVPVTEQELLTQGNGNNNIAELTPATGAPTLDFPLVKANGGAPNTDTVAAALRDWFSSQSGRVALAESGMRPADGSALEGRGMASAKLLNEVPGAEFNQLLGAFGVFSVPSSVLAVFDVSGSMNFPADSKSSRMDLAAEAALTALEAFPEHTRLGVWAFSIDQGGKGKDYIELGPMKRLNENTKGTSHKRFMAKQVEVMQGLVGGGTGLYDTTLAAYAKAVEEYDRNYYNTVVLLGDGANDDPGSISMSKLLSELEKLKDPNRPVRIIGIGIAEDADMPAMDKIAKATGGRAYQAMDPNDILDVLAKAIAQR